MNSTTQELLNSFERLSEPEQLELATEILRRTLNRDLPILFDEALILSAEELFSSLDQSESEHE